jgi:hypothetical protein
MLGKAVVAGEVSDVSIPRSHRGIGDSTRGMGEHGTREASPGARGWHHGQRSPREGQGRRGEVADGPVVLVMPGNAGGGKGP